MTFYDFERYDPDDLNQAVKIIKEGGIILYPTDTIWGIGCDATNHEAIKRIYDLKKRNDSKSMLVLVGSESQLERYVKTIPEAAELLMEASVKPLTIIYDNPIGIAENLLAEDGSLGIRVTHEKFSGELCRRVRKPIVSTSANISGCQAPRNFREVDKKIIEGVDYVVKYRQLENQSSMSSHIIKVSDSGIIKIIR